MPLQISKEELQKVLVECKLAAYAGGGENSYRDVGRGIKLFTKTLSFPDSNHSWTFYDEFSGDVYFSGRELFTYSENTKKETGVWSMVYRAEILYPELDHRKIFDFLRESLKAIPVDAPFRGPGAFKSELFPQYEYRNEHLGATDIKSGFGMEKIFYKGEQSYFGIWSGGLILDNFGDIRLY